MNVNIPSDTGREILLQEIIRQEEETQAQAKKMAEALVKKAAEE